MDVKKANTVRAKMNIYGGLLETVVLEQPGLVSKGECLSEYLVLSNIVWKYAHRKAL
jgi:hypothetical protein